MKPGWMSAMLTGVLWAAGAAAQDGPVDWLFYNGRVLTMDANDAVAEAVAVRAGRIVAVGDTERLAGLRESAARAVDLAGRTVIPGLVDTHVHAIRAGLTFSQEVSWVEEATLASALEKISRAAAERPAGEWITVIGSWHFAQFPENRMPTPAELDAAAPEHPVYVQHLYDTAIVNRVALERLGLSEAGNVPSGIGLETGPGGGPTGVMRGSVRAFAQLYGRLPKPSPDDQEASTMALFRYLLSFGMTGFADSGGGGMFWPDHYRALLSLWEEGRLPMRVRFRVLPQPAHNGRELATLQGWVGELEAMPFDPMLRWAGLGEAFLWGMHDGDRIGLEFHPDPQAVEDFAEIASWAAAGGYTTEIHASSDSSAGQILDLYEEISRRHDIGGLRWAICHIDDASTETLDRMRKLGMSYNVQDRLYYAGDAIVERVGAERASAYPPLATAVRSGINVAGGSDAHRVSPLNPMRVLQWMVDGRSVSGLETRSPGERLSRLQALRTMTANAAWALREEGERGTLEVRKLADLAVLDQDYLEVPAGRIHAIRSLLTLVGGKAVYAVSEFEEYDGR